MSSAIAAAPLHLRLKSNVDVFRHAYRGEIWYVFHDRALDRFYRVSSAGGAVLAALDGSRPLGEVMARLRDSGVSGLQDEDSLRRFLLSLDGIGLLAGHAGSRPGLLERQRQQARSRSLFAFLKSPISFKIPLFDPEPLLRRLAPVTPWLFGRFGLLLWLAVVLSGTIAAALHWRELTDNFTDRVLTTQNLLVAGLCYPAVKLFHELMHALAMKHLGCEVRRTGLIFVALLPIPYVDASSSMALSNKYARILVAAAGVLAELFLFGAATLLWLASEPGLLRSVAYNIAILTGLSTLLFNGNPLQRYDGYYALCDLIEIPDLGTRSARTIGGLAKRWLLGDRQVRLPRATRQERRIFVSYGIASWMYRILLLFSIVFYVADSFPVIGAALALWTLLASLSAPATAVGKALGTGERRTRLRAVGRLCLAAIPLGLLLFVVPLPSAVVTEGYVYLPDDAYVRPKTAGEVTRLVIQHGEPVTAGTRITTLTNEEVDTRLAKARAAVRENEANHIQAMATSRARAGMALERLEQSRKELQDTEAEHDGLSVRASLDGHLLVTSPGDLPGRYVGRGDVLAMIRPRGLPIVRTAIPHWQIDQVRRSTQSVSVRLGFDPWTRREARTLRIVPAASDLIPSPVLSTEGGGAYAVASRDGQGLHAAEVLFWVDVELGEALPIDYFNGKAHVRFDLGSEPLGFQILRQARLAFLRHFHA